VDHPRKNVVGMGMTGHRSRDQGIGKAGEQIGGRGGVKLGDQTGKAFLTVAIDEPPADHRIELVQHRKVRCIRQDLQHVTRPLRAQLQNKCRGLGGRKLKQRPKPLPIPSLQGARDLRQRRSKAPGCAEQIVNGQDGFAAALRLCFGHGHPCR